MGAAVLRSQNALALRHQRVSFDPALTTPPPKPSRSSNRAERSSPPSASRSAPKTTPSPVKLASQARPGRKARVSADESPPARRLASGGGGAGTMVAKLPGRNLVMGEVTILKRGEDPRAPTDAASAASADPVASASKPTDPPHPLPPAADRVSEEAAVAAAKADDVVFSSTERLGPEPEILPKQIRLTHNTKSRSPGQARKTAVYAGSGFITSPSPSCLPFPASFFAKKDLVDKAESATNTIKYLLRLDLA